MAIEIVDFPIKNGDVPDVYQRVTGEFLLKPMGFLLPLAASWDRYNGTWWTLSHTNLEWNCTLQGIPGFFPMDFKEHMDFRIWQILK